MNKAKELNKFLDLVIKAQENGVDISEQDLYDGITNALERDFGKLDLGKLTWWDRLVVNIKYLLKM